MNKLENSTNILSHLEERATQDLKSKEIIEVLEQLKSIALKITDTNNFENEWIKIMELLYDQIALLKEKQKVFKDNLENMLKEEWISFVKETEAEPKTSVFEILTNPKFWGNDNGITLSWEDFKMIEHETCLQASNIFNRVIKRMDQIFDALLKLKSCSFNSDEYKNLKNELSLLVYWDNFIDRLTNISEAEGKESLLKHFNQTLNDSMALINRKKWKKINEKEKPQLLGAIIEILSSRFDIENIDSMIDFYKKNRSVKVYINSLSLDKENDNDKNVDLAEKIQSLMNEIAIVITEKSPEIESLMGEKIWKVVV